MNNKEGFSKLIDILPELFETEAVVIIEPKGMSMYPTIKEGDKVYIVKPDKLRRYDIVLFRDNEKKPVLHRIISRTKDKNYVMQGDSQSVKEKGITAENIAARVICIERKGKKIRTRGFLFYLRSFIVLRLKYIKRIFKKAV